MPRAARRASHALPVKPHQLRRHAVGAVARTELATRTIAPRVRAARRVDRHRVAASARERRERDRAQIAQKLRRRARARVTAAELTCVAPKASQLDAALSAREHLRLPQASANRNEICPRGLLLVQPCSHTGRAVDIRADRARCIRSQRPASLASKARRPAAAAAANEEAWWHAPPAERRARAVPQEGSSRPPSSAALHWATAGRRLPAPWCWCHAQLSCWPWSRRRSWPQGRCEDRRPRGRRAAPPPGRACGRCESPLHAIRRPKFSLGAKSSEPVELIRPWDSWLQLSYS